MKSIFRNTLVKPGAAIALVVAGLLGGTAAQAAGTASGTIISNLATLAYSVGTVAQNAIGSSATGNTAGAGTNTNFSVDNKVNLVVSAQDTTFVPVVPNQTTTSATALQVATFKVKNTGNTAQGFLLTTANLPNTTALFGGADTIDSNGACTIKVDTAVGAVGGTVTAAGYATAATAASIASIAADVERIVYVVCPIAGTVVDGDIAVISLTAQAVTASTLATLTETTGANDNAVVDIVFADIAGTDDNPRDAKSSSRDAFKVTSAKLTVTKSVTPICDPFNGSNNPKNIPGSFVSYTISIANSGSTSATLTTISDTLDVTNLAFDVNLITGAGTATPGTSCSTASTAYTSGLSKGFKVVAPIARASYTGGARYFTSASDADGVEFATPTITATFATLLPAEGVYAIGELKPTETVSVTFQVNIR